MADYDSTAFPTRTSTSAQLFHTHTDNGQGKARFQPRGKDQASLWEGGWMDWWMDGYLGHGMSPHHYHYHHHHHYYPSHPFWLQQQYNGGSNTRRYAVSRGTLERRRIGDISCLVWLAALLIFSLFFSH